MGFRSLLTLIGLFVLFSACHRRPLRAIVESNTGENQSTTGADAKLLGGNGFDQRINYAKFALVESLSLIQAAVDRSSFCVGTALDESVKSGAKNLYFNFTYRVVFINFQFGIHSQ